MGGEFNATPWAVAEIIERDLKPILLGRDPFDIEKMWSDYFFKVAGLMRLKGLLMYAISGVDIALWDIMGKSTGLPIHKLLGGACRNKIRAYATGFYFKGIKELQEEATRYVERGFTAMKFKIGVNPQKDRDIVRAIRDIVGDDAILMADANCRYNAHTAINLGRFLEKYDVYWFEEPVPSEDIDGYVKVSSALDIAVAAGECEFARYGFRDLIVRGAVDIVQPDCTKAGGLTECKKIADLASTWNMLCIPHVWGSAIGLAAHLQFIASIPNCNFLEYDQSPNPLREELCVEPFECKNGFVKIPKKPGLGIELSDNCIRKYQVK